MFGLIRSLCTLIGFIVLVSAGLYLSRDAAGKMALLKGIESSTGFPAEVGAVKVSGSLPLTFKATELVLKNPPGFREREAIEVRLVEVLCDQPFWSNDKIRFAKVALDIPKIVAVRSSGGEMNLALLKGAQKTGSPEKANNESPFIIRELDLSLGRVLYYDFMQSDDPRPMSFDLGIRNEIIKNVSSPQQLQQLILFKILRKTPLKIRGAAFDTLPLNGDVPQSFLKKLLPGTAE